MMPGQAYVRNRQYPSLHVRDRLQSPQSSPVGAAGSRRRTAHVCVSQQSDGRQRAIDCGGTYGDVIKITARSLSEPSLVLQIPLWLHCVHTEAGEKCDQSN